MKLFVKAWAMILMLLLSMGCSKKEVLEETPVASLEIGIDGSKWNYDHYDAVVGNQGAGGLTGKAGLVKLFSLHIGVTDGTGATDYPLQISLNTLDNARNEGIKIGRFYNLTDRNQSYCITGDSELIFDCEGVVASLEEDNSSFQLARKLESILTITDCDPKTHLISGDFSLQLEDVNDKIRLVEGQFTNLPYIYLPE